MIILLLMAVLLLSGIIAINVVQFIHQQSRINYVLLPVNITYNMTVNSIDHSAIEFSFVNNESDIEIEYRLRATNEIPKVTPFEVEGKNCSVGLNKNCQITRYWPSQVLDDSQQSNGSITCRSLDKINGFVTWKWYSSTMIDHKKKGENYFPLNCKPRKHTKEYLKCSTEHKHHIKKDKEDKADNNNFIAITFCSDEETEIQYSLNFDEVQLNVIEPYNLYSMGQNTDNANSVTVPITDEDKYIYIVVKGIEEQSKSTELRLQYIPRYDNINAKDAHDYMIMHDGTLGVIVTAAFVCLEQLLVIAILCCGCAHIRKAQL